MVFAWRLALAAALALSSLILSSSPAAAFNLTGTWQGYYVCKWHFVDGSKGVAKSDTQFVYIIHDANLDLALVDDNGDHDYDYTGFIIRDGKHPESQGQLAIASCSTTANIATGAAEIVKLGVNAKNGKGVLKGASILTFPLPDAEVDECKWSFKLISRVAPIYNTFCGM